MTKRNNNKGDEAMGSAEYKEMKKIKIEGLESGAIFVDDFGSGSLYRAQYYQATRVASKMISIRKINKKLDDKSGVFAPVIDDFIGEEKRVKVVYDHISDRLVIFLGGNAVYHYKIND